jgi:2-iminoacetate synthase ThiH
MFFTQQRATELWESNDLISLGREADALRRQIHPDRVVTYTTAPYEVVEIAFPQGTGIEERVELLSCFHGRGLLVIRPIVDQSATGMEYVKTVALTRLCLDNIPHIQANWDLFGLKIAQVALRFGADDLGMVDASATEEELRRLIRDAGFIPKRRDALFQWYSVA